MGGDWLAKHFEDNRGRQRAVPFRVLGSVAEADDAVQEAWLRFSGPTPARSRTSPAG